VAVRQEMASVLSCRSGLDWIVCVCRFGVAEILCVSSSFSVASFRLLFFFVCVCMDNTRNGQCVCVQ
jgi:hypothetical protein